MPLSSHLPVIFLPQCGRNTEYSQLPCIVETNLDEEEQEILLILLNEQQEKSDAAALTCPNRTTFSLFLWCGPADL